MQPEIPVYTFYAILVSSLGALVVSHYMEVSAKDAMPIFIGGMLFGVVLGEVAERLFKRT